MNVKNRNAFFCIIFTILLLKNGQPVSCCKNAKVLFWLSINPGLLFQVMRLFLGALVGCQSQRSEEVRGVRGQRRSQRVSQRSGSKKESFKEVRKSFNDSLFKRHINFLTSGRIECMIIYPIFMTKTIKNMIKRHNNVK